MEPLKTIKPIQILTAESIFNIELLTVYLKVYMEQFPNEKVLKTVTEVEELIKELKS